MGRETLKPCPFCGAALKPFISTREITTADGRKIGEIKHGYWAHPDDSKCPLGFGFSLALEEADSWNHRKEDNLRWRKTEEEPPVEKDGNQYGDVLVLDASLEGFVTNKGWLYVKRAPDIYPIWMPIPKLPKEVEECLKYAP